MTEIQTESKRDGATAPVGPTAGADALPHERLHERHGLGLTLFGGGARAAYQVGVLKGLANSHPDLDVPFITGISAGAINAAHLSSQKGTFAERTASLAELWNAIDVDRVFETQGLPLLYRTLCIGMRLAIGWAPTLDPMLGMVDSSPLSRFLEQALGGRELDGIEANLASGSLKAVALVALKYSTSQTISFCMGQEIIDWERPLRRSQRERLTVDHILASAALPLFFPPVQIDGEWYGDGGIRLTAPLAPVIHLGADRLLAISTRYRPTGREADQRRFDGPPRAAQIFGSLMGATFLDVLDQDAYQLDRINSLLEKLPPEKRGALRPLRSLLIRPSADIARLANDFEPRLPGTFRFLTRRWGTRKSRSQELLSTILFQEDYVKLLMEIGERDGVAHADALSALLDETPVTR
ncbi:Patatin-like phospholipase [Planctomycetes bacterium Poly30]|uniref:Patatin-like phospholipase n=1 Tax=Saltatorellus ferox TaxID=2528018 RepID=A0A518EXU3_9BACT|nr:Patatin-like phospholipase [Planctomycetes bacterium Poly30]